MGAGSHLQNTHYFKNVEIINYYAAFTLRQNWRRLLCELNIFQFSESPRSLRAFAVESPTSKNFSTGSKNFQFTAQSPWSRTAVSMDLQCIRRQIDVAALRLRCEPTETAVRLRRMSGDCAVNHNGNDVVDLFCDKFT